MIHEIDHSLMPPLSASARFSDNRLYRYTLERIWDTERSPVCFVMLNPSTADAFMLDPTITRCMSYAKRWNHGSLRVVNLFAFRATDPRDMVMAISPVAEPLPFVRLPASQIRPTSVNDVWIGEETMNCRTIVAWGCDGTLKGRDREVMDLLAGQPVECLKVTKNGHPAHPLYQRADLTPVPYTMPSRKAGIS